MDILAAKGDTESWIQLIIFIIIGVVYGLSALLKSRFEGDEEQEEESEQSPAPGNRRTELSSRIPGIPRTSRDERSERAKPGKKAEPVRTKAACGRTWKPKQTIETGTEKEKSDIFSELDKASRSSKTMGKIYPGVTGSEESESQQESSARIELPGKTELQRAIVHYEIFGKPAAIRQDNKEDF